MKWACVSALLPCVVLTSVLEVVHEHSVTASSIDVRLSTIPRRIFVDNDGIVEPSATESFLFFVVVEDDGDTPVVPVEARIEMVSEGESVQAVELPRQALQAVRDVRFKTPRVALAETFDLRHHFSVPVALNVDSVRYRLTLTRAGRPVAAVLEVPLERYESRVALICPVKGRFMIVAGHDANEPHAGGWSQQHAYDIMTLGPSFGFARNEGHRNEDYFSWGQPVLAPADGVIVSARHDVADNPSPGVIDAKSYETLPDPRTAYTGNTVVIDHGQGEYSALSHLQKGSVQVEAGQHVRRGEQIGRIGSSGSSDLPHLHYQLMAGPDLFRSDGLPARFTNVWIEAFTSQVMRVGKAKRGIPLTAR
jgi:murein DD-endopeptidase MepM/ murein hydrolase activator NlpD